MISIRAVCFTQNGINVIESIRDSIQGMPGISLTAYIKKSESTDCGFMTVNGSLTDWVQEGFAKGETILFVGAMGIAVRAIAPVLDDKLTDSPVIVMDDMGRHVIPVLSGHVGGANEIAKLLADILNAECVITTATDNSASFAIDMYAKEKNLKIINRDGIKRVSGKALDGKVITLSVKDYPPAQDVDVLITDEAVTAKSEIVLSPRPYIVGMGFKRGKSVDELYARLYEVLCEANIELSDVHAIATIDIKEDEPGLQELSRRYRIPVIAFTARMLGQVKGEFSSSDFVASTVGVDNVCERACMLAAGMGARMIVPKTSGDGVTVAVAIRSRFSIF